MSCLSVQFEKRSGGISVTFGLVCGTSFGENYLLDKNGVFLLDSDNLILTVK